MLNIRHIDLSTLDNIIDELDYIDANTQQVLQDYNCCLQPLEDFVIDYYINYHFDILFLGDHKYVVSCKRSV